jgi:hypothetical protein
VAVYTILKTANGWGLYKSGSKRAKLEAEAKEDIVKMSAEFLIKKQLRFEFFRPMAAFRN